MHKVFDEFGLQVVGVTPLPCRDFYGHAAFGFHAQSLVDIHQSFRADVASQIDFCCIFHIRVSLIVLIVFRLVVGAGGKGQSTQKGYCYFLHCFVVKLISYCSSMAF